MRVTFDLMAWRASLETAPRIPRPVDLDDWAAILAEAGETSGAGLLTDSAAICRGFAPEAGSATASMPNRASTWTIGLVLSEIDALGSAFVPQETPAPRRRVSGDPNEEGGIGPAEPLIPPPADLMAAAAALRAFLSSPDCDAAQAAAAATILGALVEADKRLPRLDYRRLNDRPLAELAYAIGFAALVSFALETRDLAIEPLGSIAFLHRVAQLDHEGSGPYFSGIGQIARKSSDVFDLARRAVRASCDRSTFDAWTALLSRGCSGPLLMEIIDDLGDADRSRALSLILEHMLSRLEDEVELPLVRRVRDAGLDNADWTLAARAQAALVRLRPQDYHERVILGSIQATGGDYESAEWVFRECLRHADDRDASARLKATLRKVFRGYEVLRGFESPADRQETRLRRRGVLSDHVPRTGERITAVDVD